MQRLIFALCLSLCACTANASGNIFYRVVAGTGFHEPVLTIPRGPGAATICGGRELPEAEPIGEPVALYPARGVTSVTFDQPFATSSNTGRRHCDLIIQGRPLIPADGEGTRLDYQSCSLLIGRGAPQKIVVAPRTAKADGSDRFVLAECLYRLSMYVEGYKGALAEPSETMFYPSSNSVHASKPWVGSTTTAIPWAIGMRCPKLADFYYRGNLFEALRESCPAFSDLLKRD